LRIASNDFLNFPTSEIPHFPSPEDGRIDQPNRAGAMLERSRANVFEIELQSKDSIDYERNDEHSVLERVTETLRIKFGRDCRKGSCLPKPKYGLLLSRFLELNPIIEQQAFAELDFFVLGIGRFVLANELPVRK
jgi:hypothetical protein